MKISKRQWMVLQVAALLLFVGAFLVIHPYNAKADTVHQASISGMSGSGHYNDPYVITTCENLQSINEDPDALFVINNDIDCSDSINWAGGTGFNPIGTDTPFSGTLDGRGHTIDGLYIDRSGNNGGDAPYVGLFAQASGNARFLNFSLTNAQITGNTNTSPDAATGGVLGFITYGGQNSISMSDVHFNGTISFADCLERQSVGGIVGMNSALYGSSYGLKLSRTSSTGSIYVTGSGCGQYSYITGGLVGRSNSTSITDSYSSMNITLDGAATTSCTGECRDMGGLVGLNAETSTINHSYASGTLTVSGDSSPVLSFIAGGVVGKNWGSLDLQAAFAATPLNVPSPCDVDSCDLGPGHVGGLVGHNNGSGSWGYNQFDTTALGMGDGILCADGNYNNYACTYGFTGVDVDHYKNTSAVDPFYQWNFSSTWQTTSVYPELQTVSNPNPPAVTGLTAIPMSNSRISLKWDANSNPYVSYSIFYKRTSDTEWVNSHNGIYQDHQVLGSLDATSQYEFEVVSVSPEGYFSQPATATATPGAAFVNSMQGNGTIRDPYQITDCADLQAMQLNLGSVFVLHNDIDCSDTINWNDGYGFTPVGDSSSPFTGTLDGHGHAIDSLYIDGTGGGSNYVGLFGYSYGSAHLLNFNVTNAIITGNTSGYSTTGGIVGEYYYATGSISRVSFDGTINIPSCNNSYYVGGIAGDINGTSDLRFNRSSSSGNIMVSGSGCNGYNTKAGGLAGSMINTNITDSYSSMNITVDGQATENCGSNCRRLGGLVGKTYISSINNSYATGMLTVSGDNGSFLDFAAGGLIGEVSDTTTVTNDFAATPLNVPSPCDVDSCDNWPGFVGGVSGLKGVDVSTWTNNFFDYSALGLGLGMPCVANEAGNTGCVGVNTDGSEANYFKNNPSNLPLDSWDFSSIWQTTNEYPTLRTNSSPNPNTPANLIATTDSTSQITLSWTAVPNITYIVGYKKVADPSSNYVTQTLTGGENQLIITSLDPGTAYDFYIIAVDADGYNSQTTTTNGTTATPPTPGFTQINTCQQLEDMNNDLTGYYELARDIDCSDTVTWNNGAGFLPIGTFNFGQGELFTGIFKGNAHTISNLYINQSGSYICAALFSGTFGATIQDVKFANPVIIGSTSASTLSGYTVNTVVTNVHVSNGSINNDGLVGDAVAGIATSGLIAINFNNFISDPSIRFSQSRNNFTGTINSTGNAMFLGGLYGYLSGDTDISDSYANAIISTENALSIGGFAGANSVGMNDYASTITNSYAAGSISVANMAGNGPFPVIAGEFIGSVGLEIAGPAPDDRAILAATNNFAHVTLPVSNSPAYTSGGFIGASLKALALGDISSNYFDADLAGTTNCVGMGSASTCQAISGQPSYFKNNSSNSPLNQWDFTNIWNTSAEFPIFDARVINSVTTGTTRPPATNGQACFTSIFSTKTCPSAPGTPNTPESPQGAATSIKNTTGGGTQGSSSIPADEVGVLGAIKHFVRSLPTVVVVGFPYALFLLLGLAALVLLVELVRELRRLHLLQVLIHKQQLLAEERDAFWHLAANYLRAPVTLIVGGAEALNDVKSTTITQELSSIATSLQTKVAEIMKKIEGSTSLQAISHVQNRGVVRIARRAVFIIPVVIIAGLTLLGDYAATSYRGLNPGLIGYAMQLAGFILASVLFYWILNLLTQGKSKRKAADATLERQTNELANARHELINDTANSLNPDLTKLESTFAQLPAEQAALEPTKTLTEGASRLREIVRSFALLIKVQEGTGAVSTAPEASTIDLSTILSRARTKLTPQIAAKHLQVSSPAIPLTVTAEADLANQVLDSIISNAVDYSPEGGTVKVEAQKLQDKIQLRISDEGQGINKTQLDHLFQPFVRADGKSAMDMSHGGFGINLYLDKLIMEQLGGSITASSTPGKGTSFTMEWPTS